MPFAVMDGIRIWYETYGPAEGPLVVALHGFTGNHSTWEALAASPIGTRVHLLTPDLYGHGWSDAPDDLVRFRLAAMAADVWGLVDRVRAGARPVLLGYSMGGRLALEMAVQAPERARGLILESASPGLRDAGDRERRRADDAAWAALLRSEGVEAFVDRWERLPLFASQARLDATLREQVRRDRLSQTAEGLARSLLGSGTGSQPPRWEDLNRLALPVLLVVGALDERYRVIGEEMAGRLPDVLLAVVEDAGHSVHLEQPERFHGLVADFLAAVAPGRGTATAD
jgi:2-succinyl-6-hydroxy-2,4-cyclohexadiene-1-carboxylate synthase